MTSARDVYITAAAWAGRGLQGTPRPARADPSWLDPIASVASAPVGNLTRSWADRGRIAVTDELERQVVQSRIVANDHHRGDARVDVAEPAQQAAGVSGVQLVRHDHRDLAAERRPRAGRACHALAAGRRAQHEIRPNRLGPDVFGHSPRRHDGPAVRAGDRGRAALGQPNLIWRGARGTAFSLNAIVHDPPGRRQPLGSA